MKDNKPDCIHNARCRYTYGFLCEDCGEFFHIDSATYRRGELLSSIWMVLNNINCHRHRKNLPPYEDVDLIKDEIGIRKNHDHDYEDLIARAEVVMAKYNKDSTSATNVMKM